MDRLRPRITKASEDFEKYWIFRETNKLIYGSASQ